MVHSVMRSSVEDPFNGPEIGDVFRVYPELIEEVELIVCEQNGEWDSYERARVVEADGEEVLEGRLTNCCAQVVVLR